MAWRYFNVAGSEPGGRSAGLERKIDQCTGKPKADDANIESEAELVMEYAFGLKYQVAVDFTRDAISAEERLTPDCDDLIQRFTSSRVRILRHCLERMRFRISRGLWQREAAVMRELEADLDAPQSFLGLEGSVASACNFRASHP